MLILEMRADKQMLGSPPKAHTHSSIAGLILGRRFDFGVMLTLRVVCAAFAWSVIARGFPISLCKN